MVSKFGQMGPSMRVFGMKIECTVKDISDIRTKTHIKVNLSTIKQMDSGNISKAVAKAKCMKVIGRKTNLMAKANRYLKMVLSMKANSEMVPKMDMDS